MPGGCENSREGENCGRDLVMMQLTRLRAYSGHASKDVADVERVAREIHILKLVLWPVLHFTYGAVVPRPHEVQHPHIIQLYEIIETPRQLRPFLLLVCSFTENQHNILGSSQVSHHGVLSWRGAF